MSSYSYPVHVDFSSLMGKTITSVDNQDNTKLRFTCLDGDVFEMYHEQDCCESVWLYDTAGDLADILATPVLEASVETNSTEPSPEQYSECHQWTFYKLGTINGHVNLRWLGESNGYYSMNVDFFKLPKKV